VRCSAAVNASDVAAPPRRDRGARELPARVGLCGAGLVGCASLPATPDGACLLELVREAFAIDALQGLLMVLGFGSPVLFGAVVTAATFGLPGPLGRTAVRVPLALMHAHLVLVTIVVAARTDAIAALPMLGFAVVSALLYITHVAATSAGGDGSGPTLAWSVRWGAMLIAATATWARLQWLGGVQVGIAFDVAAICSALIVADVVRHEGARRAAAPADAGTEAPEPDLSPAADDDDANGDGEAG